MGFEGFVERGGVAAAIFRGKSPDFCHFPGSQWSTLQSGPLAHAFSKLLPGFCHFPGSQWSTLQSGPLAHVISGLLPGILPFSGKPVVHSLEWTTSSRFIGAKARNSAFSREASGPLFRVDHWLASFCGKSPEFCLFPGSQWTTLQSGPLARFISGLLPDFCHFPGSQWTTLQSGPLARQRPQKRLQPHPSPHKKHCAPPRGAVLLLYLPIEVGA